MTKTSAVQETRTALEALRRIVQALRVTARDAELRHGLSAAQIFVLHLLARDGAASVNELAERSFTHQSSVSVVVARLAAAGLVVSHRSEADRRRAEIALSAPGRALLRRIPEPAQTGLVAAIERVPPDERRQLAHGLEALVREMGIDRGIAGMFFEDGATRSRARAKAAR